MPTGKLLCRCLAIANALSVLTGVLLWTFGRGTAALALGFGLGAGTASLGLWLFFCAWRAAPDGGGVALYYVLRLAVVFGGVLAALFVPAVDALGVIVPQFFPVPVLAVLLALEKEE